MRKALYIFFIPLLFIEWTVDTISRLIAALHQCIKELTISIKNIINEPAVRAEPDKATTQLADI